MCVQPLGPALSRAKLLESQGFKVVLVPFGEWAGLASPQDKAKLVLNKIKTALPGAAGKVRLAVLRLRLRQGTDAENRSYAMLVPTHRGCGCMCVFVFVY